MFSFFSQSDKQKFVEKISKDSEDLMILSYIVGLGGIFAGGIGNHQKGLDSLENSCKSCQTSCSKLALENGFADLDIVGIINQARKNAIKRVDQPEFGSKKYILEKGMAINRMSNSFSMALHALDSFSSDKDYNNLVISACFFFMGIQISMFKWWWTPSKTMFRIQGYESAYGKVSLEQAVNIYDNRYETLRMRFGGPTFNDIINAFITQNVFLNIWKGIPKEIKYKLIP